jgi:predicted DCC family thiol-disulfide oxidoreductase YuxK
MRLNKTRRKKAESQYVAIYDDTCGLCRRFVSSLRTKISRDLLVAVPCGHPDQARLAPGVRTLDCFQAFTLVTPDGKILSGSTAAAKVTSLVPELKTIQWLVDSKAGRSAAGIVYKTAQKIRRRDV